MNIKWDEKNRINFFQSFFKWKTVASNEKMDVGVWYIGWNVYFTIFLIS